MKVLNESNLREIVESDASIGFKVVAFIHSFETDLSEAVYKIWCKLTGGKFRRNESKSPTACLLVRTSTTHLFTDIASFLLALLHPLTFLFQKKDSVKFSLYKMQVKDLEMFELKCPEGVSFGKPTFFVSSKLEKGEKCAYCGRCLKVQKGDRKIVGKFKNN